MKKFNKFTIATLEIDWQRSFIFVIIEKKQQNLQFRKYSLHSMHKSLLFAIDSMANYANFLVIYSLDNMSMDTRILSYSAAFVMSTMDSFDSIVSFPENPFYPKHHNIQTESQFQIQTKQRSRFRTYIIHNKIPGQ